MTFLNKAVDDLKSLYTPCLGGKPRGTWRSQVNSESPRPRRDRTWGPDRSQQLGMLQNQTNTEETLIINWLTVAGCSRIFTGVIIHPIPPADSQLLDSQILPATSPLPPASALPAGPRWGADAVRDQVLPS